MTDHPVRRFAHGVCLVLVCAAMSGCAPFFLARHSPSSISTPESHLPVSLEFFHTSPPPRDSSVVAVRPDSAQ